MKLFLICLLISVTTYAQQTSTDTAWKEKYRVAGQTVPPYPSELTVAQDGSGDYRTIQEAVHAVRDLSQAQVTIHIKAGTYREKLVIPSWKTNVRLVGESSANTIVSNADFSGKAHPEGKDYLGRAKYSTYTSYTVLVQGNDFSAENLTIENTAGRVGQAVALHVEGDRAVIRNCRLLGNQDTVYTATEGSRQFYTDCYIEGTTDFIFGEATCVFRRCTIKSLSNSYVTAAATRAGSRYGYVFMDCSLIAAPDVTKCYLGRPWRPDAQTVFLRCDLGAHILPVGWHNWGKVENERTVLYAEYGNTGAGAATDKRAAWARVLTKKQAAAYTLKAIFSGWGPE